MNEEYVRYVARDTKDVLVLDRPNGKLQSVIPRYHHYGEGFRMRPNKPLEYALYNAASRTRKVKDPRPRNVRRAQWKANKQFKRY